MQCRRGSEQAPGQNGAGMQKPDGLTVLDLPDVPANVAAAGQELFGVGSRLEKRLRDLNIGPSETLLPTLPVLQKRFGLVGHVLHLSANGLDYSPLTPAPGTGKINRASDYTVQGLLWLRCYRSGYSGVV